MAFQGLTATNLCGNVGQAFGRTTVALDPLDISTVPQISTSFYWHDGAMSLTFIKQSPTLLDFGYFNNCSTGTILPVFDSSTYNPDMTWQGTPPCHPVFAIPTKVLDIDAAWGSASCTDLLGGFYDPPIAMQPAPALLPDPITPKPTNPPSVSPSAGASASVSATLKHATAVTDASIADPRRTQASAGPASEKPHDPTVGLVTGQNDLQNPGPSLPSVQAVIPAKPSSRSTSIDPAAPASQYAHVSGGDLSLSALATAANSPVGSPGTVSTSRTVAIAVPLLASSNSMASVVSSFVAALQGKPSSTALNAPVQPSNALGESTTPGQSATARDPIASFVMSALGGRISTTAVSTAAAANSFGRASQTLFSGAIYTAGSQTYTASQTGGNLVIGALTITPGGPVVLLSGHALSAATSGIEVDGSSIQISALPTPNPTAGTLTGAVIFVGSSAFTASKDPIGNDLVIGSKTISLGGPVATVNGAIVSLGPNGVVMEGTTTVPLSSVDVNRQYTTNVLSYNASSNSVTSGISRCISVLALLTIIYNLLQRALRR